MVYGVMENHAHRFICWFPVALPAAALAVCSIWDTPKALVGNAGVWVLDKMSEPRNIVILFLLGGILLAGWMWLYLKTQPEKDPTPNYADLAELLAQRLLPAKQDGYAVGMPLPPISVSAMGGAATVQPDSAAHARTTTSSGIVGQLAVVEGDDSAEITGVTGLHGLYVGNIIVAAGALEKERRLEIAIVGYNGSGENIQISDVSGRITAGVGNMRDYVKLPEPVMQGIPKTPAGAEFVMTFRQEVSDEQAQEYLAALDDKKHIGLDLREWNIVVAAAGVPEKSRRLPLWDGVNLRRRDDVVSSRNMILSVGLVGSGGAMTGTASITRKGETNDGR